MAAGTTAAAFYVLILISLYITTSASPTGSVCSSTPDPSYCKSALPNQTGNVYSYGRSSFRKSLSSSQKFLRLVEKHLRSRSSLTVAAVRALEDCQLLAGLNIDYLRTSFQAVNATSRALTEMKADDVQSLLSAILTNQQTCLDGIKATAGSWSLKNGLSQPLASDTKLYSLSLAFFTKGWVPKKKKKPTWKAAGRQGGFRNGRMSLKMSSRTQAIYETATRRNLLQTDDDGGDDDQIAVRDIVVVSQDGTGNFTTINEAIAAAPNNSAPTDGYFLIFVSAGVYEEYVSIAKNKRYLMMIGDGINQTIVTGNRSVVDGWTTFNSATFAVVGPGFVAVNMTFRNTAGAIKHQAVALRNGADLSTFYLCSFEAYQDTLYTHSLRQFYRDCDIYGTVDFIFGNAAVVFQNCNIYPRLPMSNQFNAITAQGRTDPNQNTGTSIYNCRITAADDLANNSGAGVKTFLGRPWKEYSRTVYMQSFMDDLINPAGWRAWDGDFALNTSYYAEFGNFGPGSNTSERVNWPGFHLINDTDAGNFTAGNFVLADDWLPQTGVPYTSGLTE
ncbi:putative pectinesterase/pectinesterase inhibitor 7 [Cucumis melo var. makuwa]|uniref:Pectinesterase n=2 Tax=Cucumis melo TaxID=3656 RepID=A0A5D3D3H4_CUCMM|nr:putative pectinesterase/pectinesterase inhibitor 7 [Cucumis melo var. makuwa]TYK18194.1 putative pectinesterase/pectinesterase inhibitor 7 [Cucumis melo var. makuwa]